MRSGSPVDPGAVHPEHARPADLDAESPRGPVAGGGHRPAQIGARAETSPKVHALGGRWVDAYEPWGSLGRGSRTRAAASGNLVTSRTTWNDHVGRVDR